jgi:hypothetical protein
MFVSEAVRNMVVVTLNNASWETLFLMWEEVPRSRKRGSSRLPIYLPYIVWLQHDLKKLILIIRIALVMRVLLQALARWVMCLDAYFVGW